MKILLTGSNGQVGKEVKTISNKFNLELIPMDRSELNITDYSLLDKQIRKHKPEVIINAAAYTDVENAEEEKKLAELINYKAVKNLAELCKKKSILLIHLSTDYVFNGLKRSDYLESDNTDPVNTYGRTKLLGEEAIRSILEQHIIIRTSWVFGIHGNNFVKKIISLANKEESLNVISDQFGIPTSAKSIASALLLISLQYSKKKHLHYGTYHFSSRPAVSWFSFAKEIINIAYGEGLINKKITLNKISSKKFPAKAKRPIRTSLSSKKIIDIFNIEITPWKEDLREMLASL